MGSQLTIHSISYYVSAVATRLWRWGTGSTTMLNYKFRQMDRLLIRSIIWCSAAAAGLHKDVAGAKETDNANRVT